MSLRSLYRSLLRESSKLPYDYLRAFVRTKLRDDVAAAASESASITRQRRKTKNLEKELRRLTAANAGNRVAFMRLLELAWGRRGKLNWELREPFLIQDVSKKPAPIIRGVEKSRPPVYCPELKALMLSSVSYSSKAIKKSEHLDNPPTLPSRADPTSEEAKLFGTLSKRREVNIRWRFFTNITRRVLVPLEVEERHVDDQGPDCSAVRHVQGGFQNLDMFDFLQRMAEKSTCSPKTRREKHNTHAPTATVDHEEAASGSRLASPLPTRFLRRCHQSLLSRIPKLTTKHNEEGVSYHVALSPYALTPGKGHGYSAIAVSDKGHEAWVRKS